MPLEPKRGCGYRKAGAMYLCADGLATLCDRLPLFLSSCNCCGFYPRFTRGMRLLSGLYIGQLVEPHNECRDVGDCPICYWIDHELALMWVGDRYYTPESFMAEANKLGVSKRISKIPRWFRLGKTWVLLAHQKTPVLKEGFKIDEAPAIFAAFRPTRIEIPYYRGMMPKAEVKAKAISGFTMIELDPSTPELDPDHRGERRPAFMRHRKKAKEKEKARHEQDSESA